ncbi:hypothetical protein A6R68_13595, partial [Neotoma lepida]
MLNPTRPPRRSITAHYRSTHVYPRKMSDEFSCQEHHLFHGALCHQEPGDHQHHILALQDHIPHQDPILLRIILTKCLQDLLVLHQCLVAP